MGKQRVNDWRLSLKITKTVLFDENISLKRIETSEKWEVRSSVELPFDSNLNWNQKSRNCCAFVSQNPINL
jgi:hypothetical protein